MADDDTGQALASKFRRLAELRIERDITKTAAENAEREFRACEADIWDDLIESPIEARSPSTSVSRTARSASRPARRSTPT